MKSRRVAVFATVAVLAGGITVALSVVGTRGGESTAHAQCTGQAPECFPEVGMLDTGGTAWTGEVTRGKVVMVNFWASWCAPCVSEIPLLSSYYQRYRDDGFVLLGVMVDRATDDQLAAFAKRVGLSYPVVRSDELLMQAFGYPNALPTTFLYARDGTLAAKHVGPLSRQWLDAHLPELLGDVD
ncbi:MAG: TlpA family protein disulfide reductase [Deltaproteobacteria bacterium]|nr:MAG: TlpA family protein disulfide reductase [Deltaproteobacteria bacterium]